MNWDDLRTVRAVFQGGSYAAAARDLQVNETTVSRRLARIEKQLGMALFDAVDGIRKPTDLCAKVVVQAEKMSECATRVTSLTRQEQPTKVHRRIAATDSIATAVFAPQAERFLAANPGLSLEFLASTTNVNFSRWEADVAIRLRRPDKGNFLISKLAELSLYFVEPADTAGSATQLLFGYPASLDSTPESRYLADSGLADSVTFRSSNLLVLRALVQTGNFSGVLPAYMCGDLLSERSYTFTKLHSSRSAWLLIQNHLKNDPATRTLVAWIRDTFSTL